jgi:hypothetical protein
MDDRVRTVQKRIRAVQREHPRVPHPIFWTLSED